MFQTTWLRLLEHLDRIEQPERVGAWIGTTARRECLRVLRISGRQVPSGEDFDVLPDPAPAQSPDRDLIAVERSRIVNSLVEQLPMRSQLLLRLLTADTPLSYRDISETLSMPIGSIGPDGLAPWSSCATSRSPPGSIWRTSSRPRRTDTRLLDWCRVFSGACRPS